MDEYVQLVCVKGAEYQGIPTNEKEHRHQIWLSVPWYLAEHVKTYCMAFVGTFTCQKMEHRFGVEMCWEIVGSFRIRHGPQQEYPQPSRNFAPEAAPPKAMHLPPEDERMTLLRGVSRDVLPRIAMSCQVLLMSNRELALSQHCSTMKIRCTYLVVCD